MRNAPVTDLITVAVPADKNMRFEPAVTIAKGQRLRNLAFTVAAILGYALPEQLGTDLDWAIQAVVGLAALIYAWYTAMQQGKKTREVVYSPAAVETIAKTAPSNIDVIRKAADSAIIPKRTAA